MPSTGSFVLLSCVGLYCILYSKSVSCTALFIPSKIGHNFSDSRHNFVSTLHFLWTWGVPNVGLLAVLNLSGMLFEFILAFL